MRLRLLLLFPSAFSARFTYLIASLFTSTFIPSSRCTIILSLDTP